MKSEINLLPGNLIVKRKREACFHGIGRLLQRSSLLLALLIVGEICVYMAYIHLDKELTQAKISQSSDDTARKVEEINDILNTVKKNTSDTTFWSLYIEEILNSTPEGIKIKSIKTINQGDKMEIQGLSESHDAVLNFQKIIKQLSWVIRVKSPLQNFALDEDNEFTFTLIIQEQDKEK